MDAILKKEQLGAIVGPPHILDDAASLDGYGRDHSLVPALKPWFVVRPADGKQVQALVAWANQTRTPLIPVSSGPPHFHGDTVPSVPEAVIVDLGRLNAIRRIDTRNRIAVIEPGVTYGRLDAALAAEGLRISRPLAPRANKSVVASLLERQPTLIPRFNYNLPEPLRTCGVVWGTGELAFTGEAGSGPLSLDDQWQRGLAQVDPKGPLATDLMRVVTGAQGTMGIVVWASVKLELLPAAHEYHFVPGGSLGELVNFCYRLERTRLGDEVAVFNAAQLAQLVGRDAAAVAALQRRLPPWVVVVGLAGAALFPNERVEVQKKDLGLLVQQCGLTTRTGLPGLTNADIVAVFEGCSAEPHWRLRSKGAAQQIMFLTTLDRTERFTATVNQAADACGYPSSAIAAYIQPQHHGVSQHVEFTLPYDPTKRDERTRVEALWSKASHALIGQGAYFSRPYGAWADMVYSRDVSATRVLRVVKDIVDPNNVLNPGKLCF
jgi:FAD/FMN-containing dehydrogenase